MAFSVPTISGRSTPARFNPPPIVIAARAATTKISLKTLFRRSAIVSSGAASSAGLKYLAIGKPTVK